MVPGGQINSRPIPFGIWGWGVTFVRSAKVTRTGDWNRVQMQCRVQRAIVINHCVRGETSGTNETYCHGGVQIYLRIIARNGKEANYIIGITTPIETVRNTRFRTRSSRLWSSASILLSSFLKRKVHQTVSSRIVSSQGQMTQLVLPT